MDGRLFDALTRQFATRVSRREAVLRWGFALAVATFSRTRAVGAVAQDVELPSFDDDCEELKTVRIWVSAFIPKELDTNETIKGGEYAGDTGQPGPYIVSVPPDPSDPGFSPGIAVVSAIFHGDQRTFDNHPSASSRMHSDLTIDVKTGDIINEDHWLDPSIGVRTDTWDVVCGPVRGDNSRMRFGAIEQVSDGVFSVSVKAEAYIPCFPSWIAPDADFEGTFTIRLDSNKTFAVVEFEGKVDEFPAFEIYATANDETEGIPVFRRNPDQGTSAYNLPGPAFIPAKGKTTVGCRRPCSVMFQGVLTSCLEPSPIAFCYVCKDGYCMDPNPGGPGC